jgi:broad specificity phosphatase PhoE
VTRLYLVRHGRATAGWNIEPDPELDDVGRQQAVEVAERLAPEGPLAIVSSPMRRCRQTAEPLAARWGSSLEIDPGVGEIPSPHGVDMADRVEWLRVAAAGSWSVLGARYTDFRDSVARRLAGFTVDTVVFSHFVAINAAIGAATGDDRLVVLSLDNCSVTVLDVADGRLHLVEGGHEADTLIR